MTLLAAVLTALNSPLPVCSAVKLLVLASPAGAGRRWGIRWTGLAGKHRCHRMWELQRPAGTKPRFPVLRKLELAWLVAGLQLLAWAGCAAGQLGISSFLGNGALAWTNASVPGVCTVERAETSAGPWTPEANAFSLAAAGGMGVTLRAEQGFYRLRSAGVSATAQGFTNFVSAYGLLETIAGNGLGQVDGVNYWQTYYEGGAGAWAALSRPHFAMADRAGNVFIADKNSHSILKVAPEGAITTVAGTHTAGFNGEGPAPALALQLDSPNGEWVQPEGTLYILDTNNGRIRRVDTNGIMTTLFLANADGSSVSGGRGLWVKADETLAYFCAGTKLKRWTPGTGVKTLASNFIELGNLVVENDGSIVVCDRGASRVFRVSPAGTVTPMAGNGLPSGGGEGFPALETGLYGVRGVWPVPTGGYLLATHEGSQLWYLDSAGIIHLLLEGAGGRTHGGDGDYFYTPYPKIAEARSVTLDYQGNILICESDYGYVRRIRFLPCNAGH